MQSALRPTVIDQIGVPWWYSWGLGAAWVGLGFLADLNAPWWLVSVATLAVGAGHSYVFQRLVAGRSRTGDVEVSADVAGHVHVVVIDFLLALVGVTSPSLSFSRRMERGIRRSGRASASRSCCCSAGRE